MAIVTCDVTSATATGDTVETSVGTISLPSTAKRIIGIGISLGSAGTTTLEGVSGIFRVKISNLDVTPGNFPFSYGTGNGAGWISTKPEIFPVNWANIGNGVVTFYVTMDMTMTVNPTARGFVIFEK